MKEFLEIVLFFIVVFGCLFTLALVAPHFVIGGTVVGVFLVIVDAIEKKRKKEKNNA